MHQIQQEKNQIQCYNCFQCIFGIGLSFCQWKKPKASLKKIVAFFPNQICNPGVPEWRRPFEDNFILKVVVSSFLSLFEFIKLSQQHSTYVWLEFQTPSVRHAHKMEICGLVTFHPEHLNLGGVLFLKLMQRPNYGPKHYFLVDFSWNTAHRMTFQEGNIQWRHLHGESWR